MPYPFPFRADAFLPPVFFYQSTPREEGCQQELIKKLEQIKIDVLVIEDVYKLRNTNTLIKLSNLQGALKELANVYNVKIEVVHPSQWRTILNTKHKHREQLKEDSKQFVFDKFGLEVNDDLADAFCILTYYFDNIFKENE